ncbi:putative tail fiber from prophage domain protein [Escherichia coli 3-267-03_S3_C1]|nr:putative tail fiber from prophage domain protein [Escherichia coli 3-267-03_S3_C1]
MVTITVSVVRRAFSSMVHPGTGFPVPSFSTPDILTVIDFSHKKSPQQ